MVAGYRHATCRSALASIVLLVTCGVAQAQPLAGKWKAGATATNVVVESWGTDCGPRPSSSRSSGGGLVRVDQRGDVLTIVGKQRMIRSDECWSLNPSIRRVSSGRKGDVWTTRCRTPADDPREESGTYTLRALTPDRLLYQDVSRFNWQLKSSRCSASITTVQTLVRESTGAPAPPVLPPLPDTSKAVKKRAPAATAPQPPPLEAGCVPGAPARLTVRPRQARLELGGKACLPARVSDANGCPIPAASVSWGLRAPPGMRGSLRQGCFQAGERAAESEGRFMILARSGELRSDAVIHVEAEDLSALLARRLGSGALTGEDDGAEATLPLDDTPPATPQGRVATRTVQGEGGGLSPLRWTLLALVVLVAGIALIALRRRSRRQALARSMAAAAETPVYESDPPTPAAAGSASGYICPQCRQGFRGAGRCPKDDAMLVAYDEFMRAPASASTESARRCPKCGAQYPASSAFCGADGSPLEASD